MTHVYLTKSNLKIGIKQNQLTISHAEDEPEKAIPLSTVDSINVFGGSQLSTQLIKECLSSRVPIGYFSEDGHYFGKISSFENIDPLRQKKQILLTDNEEFCLEWSKKIVSSKIMNSIVFLNSMDDIYLFSAKELQGLIHSLRILQFAETRDMVLGLEGNAAKAYFACLSKLVCHNEFSFHGRSARPPKDPINSMLSYGYSFFHRSIVAAIERHSLHPYFGYMRKIKRGHAALASDLIEEYRAPLVDKAVISFANSGEVSIDDFNQLSDGTVYMSKEIMKRLTDIFSETMGERHRYFAAYGDGRSYAFQAMLDKKLCSVINAIELCDAEAYQPYVFENK